jgi:DNA-binding NtrC family response regulator
MSDTSIAARLTEVLALSSLVGRAPAFLSTIEKIPRVAQGGTAVLIAGETGTGKELCARALHHLSERRSMPFVPVDCGALPEQLVENELFGHLRGAFTDAHRDHEGLLAMAKGGTLFLDEIDSLAQAAQAKLLRVLEDGTFRPLGSTRFLRTDVRVIAATSADLVELIRLKRFRPDLYFRLNVVQLRLPPLRERASDIPVLAQHFVEQLCRERRQPIKTISPEAIAQLGQSAWPGNVRELFNAMQHALLLADGDVILARHLPGGEAAGDAASVPLAFNDAKARALAAFERTYLEQLLRKHAGNITRCAIEARKDRRVFGRLVKKHKIDRLAT